MLDNRSEFGVEVETIEHKATQVFYFVSYDICITFDITNVFYVNCVNQI
jgi:hypothetical protein